MNNVVLGAVAGAAGTMALDIVSYLDIVVRGRGSSNLPAELIRRLAEIARIEPLSKPDEEADAATKNRRAALGALAGYAVGTSVGVAYGVAHPLFAKLPSAVKALLVGGLAMAASDVPLTVLELTNPRQWGTAGWLSDIVPHFAYGCVTVTVFDSLASAS
ncbi:MAG: hypothetical protein ACXWNK_04255 [Vulcanimicrobiaceae bacterium]